ncbi:MAG: hypothetical protein M0C28_01625 [Candidatus Moduliflexus flocculans]|nr:hypothetical protein [Candidatus Moduliflexus flocculans]
MLEAFRAGDLDFRVLLDRASGVFARVHRPAGAGVREGPGRRREPGQVPLGFGQGHHAPRVPQRRHPHAVHGDPARPSPRRPDFAPRPETSRRSASPFVVKPANTTGGSIGVVADAVGTGRRPCGPAGLSRRDKYLLQEKVVPEVSPDGRRSWFRGFYVLGEVHLAWWDDRTHVYAELGPDEAAAARSQPDLRHRPVDRPGLPAQVLFDGGRPGRRGAGSSSSITSTRSAT